MKSCTYCVVRGACGTHLLQQPGGSQGEAIGMAAPSAEAVLEQAVAWKQAGRQVAIATVVATWGSSPRPVGSQLAVEQSGRFVGSVSGGCVEAAVIDAALAVMHSQQPRLLRFGVRDEEAWAVGLPCGGRIEVFVEALS